MQFNSYQTDLFNQLLEGKLDSKDIGPLVTWLGSEELDPEGAELILTQLKQPVAEKQISPELREALNAKLPAIMAQKEPFTTSSRPFVSFKRYWLRYAAAILFLVALSVFIVKTRQSSPQQKELAKHVPLVNDVLPGKDGAILTLSDGSTVVLDSLGNGVIAKQNGSNLLLHNGQLVYNSTGSGTTDVSYNTISTPKGRQFKLVLSDGTKVWLNSASSLHYPAVFTGNERKVDVTGEVYFEVAKNPKKPFQVSVDDQTKIEVLGTHFNVNAYKNETNISTTLLEGSVSIFNRDEKMILSPGQQAQINNPQTQSRIKIVNDVDVEKVMAWKNGVFNFQDARLEDVMRQLERWYDVDVVYEKDIPQLEFIGKMGRDLTLSEVLRGLELSKVHFRIEGRRLVVLP